MSGRDLLGEELSVGGVGAALAEAEAAAATAAAGGRDPMGNPSFHCSNISSAFLPDPFLPGGDKDPIRATQQEGKSDDGRVECRRKGAETENAQGSDGRGRGRKRCEGLGWQKKRKCF